MKTSLYMELFRENIVMTMDQLKLETGRPRESILRDLKGIGYYSSYNERGKFYTLGSTPEFDSLGLWKHQHAYFSDKRTLLDTAEYLVGASAAGYTHDELRRMLGIGVQNTLFQLTVAGKVVRQRAGAQFVYFGKEKAGEQRARRDAMPVEPPARKPAKEPGAQCCPGVEPALVIDVLVAALRGHDTEPAAHGHLQRAGSPVTAQQVGAVFRHYGIGKKNPTARG